MQLCCGGLLRRPAADACIGFHGSHRKSGATLHACLVVPRWRRAWSIRPKASWAIFRESCASMGPASKCIPAARCGTDCEKLRKRTGRGAASPPLAGGIGGGRRPTAWRLLDLSPSWPSSAQVLPGELEQLAAAFADRDAAIQRGLYLEGRRYEVRQRGRRAGVGNLIA